VIGKLHALDDLPPINNNTTHCMDYGASLNSFGEQNLEKRKSIFPAGIKTPDCPAQ
jgi:hypothetical protein